MNKNWMKLVCGLTAVLMLTACRSGGGETTAPSESQPVQTTAPTETVPNGAGVEDWEDPIETAPAETTEPQESSTEPRDETTLPTEPDEDPVDPPSQTDPTEPPAQTTPPTEPADTTKPTDPPAPPATTEPQVSGKDPAKVTYEEYLAMSPFEQQAHYEQFASLEDYIAWHNAALAEYEENQGSIEVTGGIDIGDFMNP